MLVREVPGRVDLAGIAAAQPERYPCLLESAAAHPRTGRFDLLFACEAQGSWIEPPHDPAARGPGGFLDRLDRAWESERRGAARDAATELPFHGGWVLFLSYELAAECEPGLKLPAPAAALPRAAALRSPAAIVYDRARERTMLVAEHAHGDWLERLQEDVDAVRGAAAHPGLHPAAWREDDPGRFLAGVARIHEYLHAGDTFQVNLSREWRAELGDGADPVRLYRALRDANPAPFSGLLRLGADAILSSSPERLIRVRGDTIETRPIAGTRPRARADEDVVRMSELIGHPKERAEHIMLLDLERNDLGRVAVTGTVEVNELMSVESYRHVHHIVSNVRARLRPGVSPGEVVRAVFPGGTITGCPKVRCMEIIAELEGVGRGPYTGALGYLGHDGAMDLNILIRTLWLSRGTARVRAGSGIVADSVPARELEETRAKARGVLNALAGA